MLLYLTLGTNDLDRGIGFCDPVMAVLGHHRIDAAPGRAGCRWDYDGGISRWLCPPFDGQKASVGNGTMVAFQATSAAQVRAWHAADLAHGGTDEGAPGIHDDYGPAFYFAYLRDPDRHKIASGFHRYSPESDR